jgi:hypothetical protein
MNIKGRQFEGEPLGSGSRKKQGDWKEYNRNTLHGNMKRS